MDSCIAENLKAVMLCDRPQANEGKPLSDTRPFIPTSSTRALEPAGLLVHREPHGRKYHRKVTILDRHKNFIREMDRSMRSRRKQAGDREAQRQGRFKRVIRYGTKLRSAILASQDLSKSWKPARQAAAVSQLQKENSESVAAAAAATQLPCDASSLRTPPIARDSPWDVAKGRSSSLQPEVRSAEEQEAKEFVAAALTAALPPPDEPLPVSNSAPALGSCSAAAPEPHAEGSGREPAAAESTQETAAGTVDKEVSFGESTANAGGAAAEKKGRPCWALTAEEAEALEEAEEEELLKFAERLDFDRFVADLDDSELKEALQALTQADSDKQGGDRDAWRRNFAKAMNMVTMRSVGGTAASHKGPRSVAAASDAAASSVTQLTESTRLKAEAAARKREELAAVAEEAEGSQAWDASTCVDGDAGRLGRMEGAEKVREAELLLRDNPDLKSNHSLASARALLAQADPAASVCCGA